MYLCDLTREQLISLLPAGGEIAEIGVAEGDFSKAILQYSAPRRLHLIDPWEHQIRSDYENDLYGNASDDEQDSRYRSVVGMFNSDIQTGRVLIHRTYSLEAASRFEDHQFDWIYVDALHSKDAVSADLLAYHHKVKSNGFILGHDYTNHAPARHSGFGVVEAVDHFVLNEGYSFLAMTMENFPTYVLAREDDGEAANQLRLRILHTASKVVEIRNFPKDGSFEHHALSIGGKTVVYGSF